MKVIFSEGSTHHLKTMEMQTAPRIGEQVIIGDNFWIVETVTHFPKENARNDNESCCAWDEDRDADMTVHLSQVE